MRTPARSISGHSQGMRWSTLTLALGLAGCATTGGPSHGVVDSLTQTAKNTFANPDPCSNNNRNIGATLGVGVGILIASQIDKDWGKAVAVLGGGLIGGLIGADMDRKRCELSKIAQQNDLVVDFEPLRVSDKEGEDGAFSMNLRDNQGDQAQFAHNSDKLTPRAARYFQQIAAQYAQHTPPPANATAEEKKAWATRTAQRKLLLIGHTDDTGSSAVNAQLSEKRARTVADLLAKHGVDRQHIYFQGAGETYPLASNDTEEGRAQNRRVEFIEVYGDSALAYYLDHRRANYALYRPAPPKEASAPPVKAAATKKTTRVGAAPTAPKTTSTPAAKTATAPTAPVAQPSTTAAAHQPSQPTPKVATAPAAQPSTAASSIQPVKPLLDFGGEPLQPSTRMVNLGISAAAKPSAGLISSAYASTDGLFIARCDQDRPRSTGAVKALSNGKAYRTHEHLKGLYGSSWAQMLNGHLVVLHKVAVLRDGSAPNNPEVKLYANYRPQQKNAKPVWSGQPEVNVYQGGNGLLYRMFLPSNNTGAGVQCMDVLFPQGGDTQAKDGKLIYGPTSQLYATDFKPGLQQ